MKKSALLLIPLVASLFSLSGCVLGHRTVALSVKTGAMASTKGSVFLRPVSDERHFENGPDKPSTPSISGNVNAVSKDELGKYVGRQRNGYGHAMGDLVLPSGETVSGKMRELVKEAFARRGYAVGTSATSGNAAEVKIDEFWAWTTPGLWSIGFDARISARFTVNHGGHTSTFTVLGTGGNNGQMGSTENWQETYEGAFDDFLAKLDKELASAGF
ncbi:MAG: hypothetical protein QM796_10560 [Chthoniobacteraceae bacterium]